MTRYHYDDVISKLTENTELNLDEMTTLLSNIFCEDETVDQILEIFAHALNSPSRHDLHSLLDALNEWASREKITIALRDK